jgi:alkylhydroperoxidase family enzyme
MGHSEMLLAVAGLNEQAIARQTRLLASGDWSAFSPAERAAFRFAREQARRPASVSPEVMDSLLQHFGPERTLAIVWWTSQCHYRTRVADALQLPLERENVFDGFAPAGEAFPRR